MEYQHDFSLAAVVDALDHEPGVTWVHLDQRDPLHALSVALMNTPKRFDALGCVEVSPALFELLQNGMRGGGRYTFAGKNLLMVFGWPVVANKNMDDDYTIRISA